MKWDAWVPPLNADALRAGGRRLQLSWGPGELTAFLASRWGGAEGGFHFALGGAEGHGVGGGGEPCGVVLGEGGIAIAIQASIVRTCSLSLRFFVPTHALPFHSLLPPHSIARKLVANFARSLREDLNLKAADPQNRSTLHLLKGQSTVESRKSKVQSS